MESEKPISLRVFIGCVLTMMSSFVAYALEKAVFAQSMLYLPSLSALVVLALGIFLMYIGLGKTE